MPLIPELGRQRQAASLVYKVSSRTAKAATQRNSISKQHQKQNNPTKSNERKRKGRKASVTSRTTSKTTHGCIFRNFKKMWK